MQSRNTKKTNWFNFFSDHNIDYKSCVYDENVYVCADGSYKIETKFAAHTLAGTATRTNEMIKACDEREVSKNKNINHNEEDQYNCCRIF